MERKIIIKIGISVVLAFAVLIWGLSFLKNDNLFKTENEYVAVYNSIDGLLETNPVTLSGYKIGSVVAIKFLNDNTSHICVKFKISNDYQIPRGSIAKIAAMDIMGTKGIEIVRPQNFDGYLENGDTLISEVEDGILPVLTEMLLDMRDRLDNFLSNSDSVMISANQLLNQQNIDNITTSLEDLSVLTNHLRNNARNIDTSLANFSRVSVALGKNSNKIDNIISDFSALGDTLSSADLAGAISKMQVALNNVNTLLNQVNNGDGSVSKLIQSDSLYNNLESASTQLNIILDEFQKHPKKYVNLSIFGGKDKSNKKNK